MITRKMSFVKSAVLVKDFPPQRLPEVAIAGRSNAGKSSLINAISNSKIAKVSNTPGKTRLLNFFNMGESYMLVDMPGYGFAARSNDEVNNWQEMIESYLTQRENLCGLILVMDIRRSWTPDELALKQFADHNGFPMLVVLTKADKISKNEKTKAVRDMKISCGIPHVFAVSSLQKIGYDEMEEFVYRTWIKKEGI